MLEQLRVYCVNLYHRFLKGIRLQQQYTKKGFVKKTVYFRKKINSFFYIFLRECSEFKSATVLLKSAQAAVVEPQIGNSVIRLKPSDLSNLYTNTASSFSKKHELIYFLRKHKLFNKGRYSRNRQTYRTGAYWCLWVNIIAVTGFYYWFYRFSMNFGYLWPFFCLFILSFVLPRAVKYNYVTITNLIESLVKLATWYWLLVKPLLSYMLSFLKHASSGSERLIFKKNQTFSVNKGLMLKVYSHWNYFLPLGWIHRAHRKFFYKRLFFIFFK